MRFRNERGATGCSGPLLLALLLGAGPASGATTLHATVEAGECITAAVGPRSAGPLASPCVGRAGSVSAPALAQTHWIEPPLPVAVPRAGVVLASLCLGWLVLLALATVVRPRGWHHRPLFGGRRQSASA